jgi:carbamate kinase
VRLVVALGGNALLERGEVPLAEIQQRHVVAGVAALVPLLEHHDVVLTHGNGPQVGLLALESARDPDLSRPYPFDVLDAQTQGMIGYLIAQAVRNALPERPVACLISQTLVAADDPAFANPTKFVGPAYEAAEATRLAERFGWQVAGDGARWRRVVPSPEPLAIVELPVIRSLLAEGVVVVCAGGGGIPVTFGPDGALHGHEAVVDKDLTSSLLASVLGADALVLLTDVAAVELGFGSTAPLAIRRSSPEALRCHRFPPGSMGPKVDASCRFVEATGNPAVIGRLSDAALLLEGAAGTYVGPGVELVTEPVPNRAAAS